MTFGEAERRAFITENLRVTQVPGAPDLAYYAAHPGSGLSRLNALVAGRANPTPYWAHIWAGGAALIQHFAAAPECAKGKRVLDLGAGSGLVGISAARAGAASVICSEIDGIGQTAISLNAALNGVAVAIAGDVTGGGLPEADLIVAGDCFYEPVFAKAAGAFLRRCAASGCEVLIGDLGRAYLPCEALTEIARYPTRDYGDGPSAPARTATVYRLG